MLFKRYFDCQNFLSLNIESDPHAGRNFTGAAFQMFYSWQLHVHENEFLWCDNTLDDDDIFVHLKAFKTASSGQQYLIYDLVESYEFLIE